MELYERIRAIRKENNLSQDEFAEKLGVTRSVISNIELNRLAKPDQKLSLIKLICKEFAINENWLIDGAGSKEIQPDTFSLDKFVKDRGMTSLELEILKTYFDLPEDIRSVVIDRFKQGLSTSNDEEKEIVEQKQEEYPDIEEELAAYRQELLAEKKVTTLSASPDTRNA